MAIIILSVGLAPLRPKPRPPQAAGLPQATGLQEQVVFAVRPLGTSEYTDCGIVDLFGKKVNLVTFRTQVIGFSDLEKIYIDPQTSLPLRVERDIAFALVKEFIVEEYFPEKSAAVITKYKRQKKVGEHVYNSDGPIQNAVILPFILRKEPQLQVGWQTQIRLPAKYQVKLAGIEEIKVPAGKFSAYHFVSVPDKFEIWISNDSRRVPLKIKDTGGLGYSLAMKDYKTLKGE
jgi:hypothetical protein